MITIQLQSEDAVTYVPDFQDNRETAASGGEAFECDLLPMSGADYDKLHSAMMGGKNTNSQALLRRAQKLVQRIVAERVVAVRGFHVRDAMGQIVESPSNGAELYRVVMLAGASVASLIDELVEAIKDQSVLDEGELGKLQARSASYAQATPQSESGRVSGAAGSTGTPKAETRSSSSLGSGSASAKRPATSETAAEKPRAVSSPAGMPN